MNDILKKYGGSTLKNSYLIDKKGAIIASSSGKNESIMTEKITSLFENKKINSVVLDEIKIDDKKYIYSSIPLNGSYLYSYGDAKKIIEPFKEKIQNMLFVILLILLAVIPIIIYF